VGNGSGSRAREALKLIPVLAEEFNCMHMPLSIERIELHDSVFRKEKAGDIDLTAFAVLKKEVKAEWHDFLTVLNLNVFNIWRLKPKRRTTMTELICANINVFKKMWFRNGWINNWLPLVRMADIYEGIKSGVLIAGFSDRKAISRFIRNKCERKRFQIEAVIVDEETGKAYTPDMDMPGITIWVKDIGVQDISKQALERHLHNEAKKLIVKAKEIIALQASGPHAQFSYAVDVIAEDKIETEQKILCKYGNYGYDAIVIIKEARSALRNGLLDVFEKLKVAALVDEAKMDTEQLQSSNTELRTLLRDVAILGVCCNLFLNIGGSDGASLRKHSKVRN